MKKFSILISIMLIALALVSCKPDYTPVGTDGFTEAQTTKIEDLQAVEATFLELVSQKPLPPGVVSNPDTETNLDARFWIKTEIKVTDEYVDATHPNVKYNVELSSKTYFYKKNSTTEFYTGTELVDEGYISATGVIDTEKLRSELKMKMNVKDTFVYKDSTSGTAVNSTLKYDVNVTAEGNQVVFDDGSLSIDLGDGKGAIGSNDKKYIAPFFETAVIDN